MKWIIKTGEHFRIVDNSRNAIVALTQKRNFAGEAGEDVLILDKKSDWEFMAHYKISGIEVYSPEAEYKEITITLALVKFFKEGKLLDDYIYSLHRITNYAYPIKHFSQKYSRLYDAEFEAIVDDKIYLKRTILGTVLNAMHAAHQKSFISFVAGEAPEILTGRTDMDKALSLLLEYLDYSVVRPAKYLKESAELLQSILSEKDLSEIGFAVDAENIQTKETQMIKPQVEAINEFLNDMFGYQNEKVGLQLLKWEDNRKFRTLFKNAPLPITLK